MKKYNRRKLLARLLSTIGILGVTIWLSKTSILKWLLRMDNNETPSLTNAPGVNDDICVLTSSTGDGPFYLSSPFRPDIREGKKGLVLNLEIQLLNHPDCTPIKDAVVEIWHCDAHGTYGGYPEVGHDPWEFIKLLEFGKLPHPEPTTNEMFLRGAQLSNENGMIKFTTILPCWYETRMPHIHMKIIKNKKESLTSELYFEEKFYNKVFTSVDPYTQYGKSPYNLSNDKNLPNIHGSTGMVLKTKWDGKEIANSFGKIGIKLS